MAKIHVADDSSFDELICTTCLLYVQYQTKRDEEFLWQCFKCGKQYLVSGNANDTVDERWDPPRLHSCLKLNL